MTLAYGVLWPGAFATDGALILMPKWGAAATLPLSIVLGWLLTYGFERPMSRAIRRCVSAPAATLKPASDQGRWAQNVAPITPCDCPVTLCLNWF